MKYYFYTVVGIVFLVGNLFFLSGAGYAVVGQFPIPVSNFPETQFESKPFPEGQKITHDFVVRNIGKAVLNIDKVKTT